MKPKEFKGVNVRIAEHQEEFVTLPAYWDESTGTMTFCMELEPDEVARMIATEELWFQIQTSGQPLQPLKLSSNREDLLTEIIE